MATIDVESEAAAAPRLLREVARLHVRAQRETLACDGVRMTECTILTELGRARALSLAQLSRRLRIDKGWTSRAVDQLLREGLVTKVASDADRRTIVISLSRLGRARYRRLEAVLNDHVARVIDRVPSDRRTAVGRALRLLHDAYVAELAEGSEHSESAPLSCAAP